MKNAVVAVIVLALVGLVGVKWLQLHNAKSALAAEVERQLQVVGDQPEAAVKETLVRKAAGLGITLKPAQISLRAEATEVRSAAQKLVGKTGLEFQNKRVTIRLQYQATLLGLPIQQRIEQTIVRQSAVSAPARSLPES